MSAAVGTGVVATRAATSRPNSLNAASSGSGFEPSGVSRRDMYERNPVIEANHLVLDVAGPLSPQLLEYPLDQSYVLDDGLGPYLVADHDTADHRLLPLRGRRPSPNVASDHGDL
jgi:hypothetical protein